MANKQMIFIGGLHRSGTTLLHDIIGSHPKISAFLNTGVSKDEGQHLQTVYPRASEFGGPGRFGFDPRSFMDEGHPLATDANAERLLGEWSRHWDLTRDFLLEKSPPNLVRTRFLQRLFPGCRFIIALRHPIAVAYATQKWSRTDIPSLVEHWLRCHERFKVDRPELAHVFVLRYEEFVVEPQRFVDVLCRWIGIETTPIQRSISTEINEKYFARWRADKKARSALLTGKSSNELGTNTILEKRFQEFGYSLDPLDSLPSVPWLGASPSSMHQR